MKTSDIPLMCNGNLLASHVLYPETIIEQFMGLRKLCLEFGQAMIWLFKKPQLQLFDTFGCKKPIGYIALNKEGLIIEKGVMQPNRAKFIICSCWIEVLPEAIEKIQIGEVIKI